MRLCQIVASLEPQYGGPSRSVPALARGLAGWGHTVDLVTTGEDSASFTGDRLRTLRFPRQRPRSLSRSGPLREHLQATPYDILHHHGLWLFPLRYACSSARRSGAPLVISPRGMLSPWAYRHRRLRKWLAQTTVHPGALREAAGWHATTEEEAQEIRALGYRQPVCVAPNGVDLPSPEDRALWRGAWVAVCPEISRRRVALFYSRFHRKKRVLELIDLWKAIAPREWLLLVAGIPEEYSVDELRQRAGAGPSGGIAVVDGRELPPPYACAELFLLPSHSENFGQVVAEAMAHGLPVAVTDEVPWPQVGREELGWRAAWPEFPSLLDRALQESPQALAERGGRARQWVAENLCWKDSARKVAEFYESLLGGRRVSASSP